MKDEILKIIKQFTKEPICGTSRIREDLGLTSFEMFLIIYKTEEIVNKKVDFCKLTQLFTVNDYLMAWDIPQLDEGELQ